MDRPPLSPSAAGNPSRILCGFAVTRSNDGQGGELIPVRVRFLGAAFPLLVTLSLGWNGLVWAMLFAACTNPASLTWNGRPGPPPPWFYTLFLVIGLGSAAGVYCAAFYRTLQWAVRTGSVVRRGRLPLLRRPRERVYAKITRLEIRHGLWDGGVGSTDILRFRVPGRSSPVNIMCMTGLANSGTFRERLEAWNSSRPEALETIRLPRRLTEISPVRFLPRAHRGLRLPAGRERAPSGPSRGHALRLAGASPPPPG